MLDLLSQRQHSFSQINWWLVKPNPGATHQQHTQVLDCHQSCHKVMTKGNSIGA